MKLLHKNTLTTWIFPEQFNRLQEIFKGIGIISTLTNKGVEQELELQGDFKEKDLISIGIIIGISYK